jgi:DNA-binding transcriptional MerR regulator
VSAGNNRNTDSNAAAVEYRMKDLIELSGLPRKTIHYYNYEGLLPPPLRAGRNTAVYGQQHLDRLLEIKRLREQELLPVKAIKAFYNAAPEAELPSGQQRAVQALRSKLPASIRPGSEHYLNYDDVVAGAISPKELKILKDEGLVAIKGRGAARQVTREDAVVLQSWMRFKELGFTLEAGFSPAMLKLWDETISALVQSEVEQLEQAFVRDTLEETLEVTASAMMVVRGLIDALHYKHTRKVFTARQEQE